MKKIGFIVYSGYSVMALAVASVFETANKLSDKVHYDIQFISETGGTVKTSVGLNIQTQVFDEESFDTLIIGGGDDLVSVSTGLVEFIKKSSESARRIAAICTGAFVLGEAGLLEDKNVTTHWMHARALKSQFPKIKLEDNRIFINDGKIWTSAGMTAGIDLGLALLENDLGREVAVEVSRKLVMYHRRTGGQSQFSSLLELKPKSDRIHLALSYARENLHHQLTVEVLAKAANLSPRQFSRTFHSETGQSPAKAIEKLRVEAAKDLMLQTTHPMEIVARMTGFEDPDRMRRAFLRSFGLPPQVIRRNNRNLEVH
jgi:transcriptional regulator GlxA family with amidase domain